MLQSVSWATHILNLTRRPTAIICQGVVTARAVIHVANQLGLSVPRDLSIVAVGPASFAESTLPLSQLLSRISRD
jgi:LacI family transcriptional regulator